MNNMRAALNRRGERAPRAVIADWCCARREAVNMKGAVTPLISGGCWVAAAMQKVRGGDADSGVVVGESLKLLVAVKHANSIMKL